jgi:hypothetical protein
MEQRIFRQQRCASFLTHGGDVEAFLKGDGRLPEKIKNLRKGTETISQRKRFFHWELGFPEIFYEGARSRQNPGFDVVVGNPPWGAALEDDEKKYISANYPVTARNFDTYVGMIERDLGVIRAGGILGYITPDAWLTGVSYVPLRKLLLASGLLLDLSIFLMTYSKTPMSIQSRWCLGRMISLQMRELERLVLLILIRRNLFRTSIVIYPDVSTWTILSGNVILISPSEFLFLQPIIRSNPNWPKKRLLLEALQK